MPELPEVQAHAERLTVAFAGATLERFTPLTFTVLKTATPAPDEAYGHTLDIVGRRGKLLLAEFGPLTFVVHLMQGGRLSVDERRSDKPRGGQARWYFTDGRAWLLTEAGTERRAGVWCRPTESVLTSPPLDHLGPEADTIDATELLARFGKRSARLHTFLRDQSAIAGVGRRLANEICHRARLSPFALTGKLGSAEAAQVVLAIGDTIEEGLAFEHERSDMSSSADRPGRVHGRVGQECPVCGDLIRSVTYSGYTVAYCPTCQTRGKSLADNTTSRFLK